jgi:predicted Zn-dependent protease
LDKAREQIDAALAISDGESLAARIANAQLVFLRADPDEQESQVALTELEALTERYPQDPRVVELRGLFAFRAQRPEDAIELLRAAHEALQSSDSAVNLAEVLWLLKRDDEALATLTAWVQRFPGDNYVRLRLTRIQLATGQFAAAAENMQEASARGAERPDLKATLAWALMRAGRLQDAKPYARDAFAQPQPAPNPLLLHTMGVIALDEGRTREGIEALEQAIKASGVPNPALRLDHAKALIRANRRDEARSALDALLSSERSFPERGEAQAVRGSLGP